MPPANSSAEPSALRQIYRSLKRRLAHALIRLISSQPEWHTLVHTWHAQEANRVLIDPRVRIGRHTYGVHPRTVFMARDEDRLTVGSFCSIAEGVRFIFGNHPVDLVTTFPLRTILRDRHARNVDAVSRGPIVVGNDVWIASDAIVLSGVTVGDGAVIGAGSVVTRDVAPYSLTAGVPARHVRFRFSEEQTAALLKIRWWDWTDETILAHLEMFYGEADAFIARFAPRPTE